MDRVSKALHTYIPIDDALPSTTPIFQTSGFCAESPYFYSRKANPNNVELEQVLCVLEGARHAISFGCGMAAIYAILDCVETGQTVVLNKFTYGCTVKLFQRVSQKRGFQLVMADLSDTAQLTALGDQVKLVLLETPTNPFLYGVDIDKVSRTIKARNPGACIVVDNTWATPLYQRPLECGADISLHSGTKYLSGHSDLLCGVALTDDDEIAEELRQVRFLGGLVLSPHDAWLARRSLQTLELRLRHQEVSTREIRDFLASIPKVDKIFYPEIDGKQLKGYGGILFFTLRAELADRYETFRDALKLFKTGTGMACATSMVAQPYTGSHSSMTPEEKEEIGLDKSLVRLCIGLENVKDLKADLAEAFATIGTDNGHGPADG